jgi:ABC-type cobalamin/Fe3+-siderophores transport system ATPase subunit
MVFVTHRFGHLTKFADQIMCVQDFAYSPNFLCVLTRILVVSRCMKDGTVAESGTHEQLLKANGEYAKLYNIQASAFADGVQ